MLVKASFEKADLTLYHSIQNYINPKERGFENILGKGENAGKPEFSLFPRMFSILSETNFIFYVT